MKWRTKRLEPLEEVPEPPMRVVKSPERVPDPPPPHKCELPYHRYNQPEYVLGTVIECRECGKEWTLIPSMLQFSWTTGQLFTIDGRISFCMWSEFVSDRCRSYKKDWFGKQASHYSTY